MRRDKLNEEDHTGVAGGKKLETWVESSEHIIVASTPLQTPGFLISY